MIKLSGEEFRELLPKRPMQSYKGAFGILGLIVGSKCYQGAAYYATTAALRSGVGISVAFIPNDIYCSFTSKVNGAVVETFSTKDGVICDDTLIDKINKRKINAVLCGSGLGLGNCVCKTVKQVLSLKIPTVIDGDGITAVSNDLSCLERNSTVILTPHMGEFSRLCGESIDSIRANRAEIVRSFSVKYKCITVLKDYITIISDEYGQLYCLDSPCSALAKGGSGDVLAGIMASYLSQGILPINSAIAGVSIHNYCGRLCADKYGERFCQPEDFIDMLSYLKV